MYDFSFTALSLRLNIMTQIVKAKENGSTLITADVGNGNSETGRKRLGQVNKRLKTFTKSENQLFINSGLTVQKQLAFLSICKAHSFIRDFAVEVLREKNLVFDYEITEGDYLSFFRRKAELYEEMYSLTELTTKKIRQVTFKVLEEAGIINSVREKIIQPQILENKLVKVIVKDNPEWLKIFLISDMDINSSIK